MSVEATNGIVSSLREKSVDELRKLLSDKEAYDRFFQSLDEVKTQNNLRDELLKETIQLAESNLEKEPRIVEIRNQCRIIRMTELALARERLQELEKSIEKTLALHSPIALLGKLQEGVNVADEESESVCRQLLTAEIDVGAFVQNYKSLRVQYHRRALTHLAARTCA